VDFTTGAFRLQIAASGRIGVSAGGFEVRATNLEIEIRRGVVARHSAGQDSGGGVQHGQSNSSSKQTVLLDETSSKGDPSQAFLIEVIGNGTMSLPQNMGHATVGLSVNWNNDALRIEARGDATLFKTDGTVVLGAVKYFTGSKKTEAYVMASLPNGIRLSNIPGLSSAPGISDVPTLAKGAKIGYSTFGGVVADLNMPFLKGDLTKAMQSLGEQFTLKGMSALSSQDVSSLTKLKDDAVGAAKGALMDVLKAQGRHTKLLQDGSMTDPPVSTQDAVKKSKDALEQVAKVGMQVMEKQIEASTTQMRRYVVKGIFRNKLDRALEKATKAKKAAGTTAVCICDRW
jgi:hypothetical protein